MVGILYSRVHCLKPHAMIDSGALSYWNSREMFPLLVDPAIEEDRFTFNDNEVTFFTEPVDPTQERINRLNRQRFFWGFPNMLKKKRSTDS